LFGVVTTMSPPGLSTRTISHSALSGNGTCSIHSDEITTSRGLNFPKFG
jgi:hypothetical protein